LVALLFVSCSDKVEPIGPPPPSEAAFVLAFETAPERGIAGQVLGEARVRVTTPDGLLAIAPPLEMTISARDERGDTLVPAGSGISDDGIALISNINIAAAGSYRLIASAPSAESATSEIITIEPGFAGLSFFVEPRDTIAGEFIAPAVEVEIVDTLGNRADVDGMEVELEWSRDNFPLDIVVSASSVDGVARFSELVGLEIDDGYRLSARAGNLRPKQSRPFAVIAPPAVELRWLDAPDSTQVVRKPWAPLEVELVDRTGARVTEGMALVTVSMIQGARLLDGTLMVSSVDGVATFPGLSYSAVERIRIQLSSPGAGILTSAEIDVRRFEQPIYRAESETPMQRVFVESPTLSQDGGRVAFNVRYGGEGGARAGVRLMDLDQGTNLDLSRAMNGQENDDEDVRPTISRDGSRVAFQSEATNYSPNHQLNVPDVFVREISTGLVEFASVRPLTLSRGSELHRNALSADGRRVVFVAEDAENLPVAQMTHLYLRDLNISTTELVASTGGPGHYMQTAAISGDGQTVLFDGFAAKTADDMNGLPDVYLTDPNGTQFTRVSRETTGQVSGGASCCAAMSQDAQFIVYTSSSDVLVDGDTNGTLDVFLYDRMLGTTERISVSSSGEEGNADEPEGSIRWFLGSQWPSVSDDGRFVVFISTASNLVAGDSNARADAFLRDRWTDTTIRISVTAEGLQANNDTREVTISGDGSVLAFTTYAGNIMPGNNLESQVYVIPNPLYP
jgi:Tol biopolymer transport system component